MNTSILSPALTAGLLFPGLGSAQDLTNPLADLITLPLQANFVFPR